jgi:TetR/AcrR family transcriptional regulator, cholesterol catabolism regulator
MAEPKQPTDNQLKRRKEIIAAAARLFAEQGFNGTSMDDIAKELGILKGSLYYWIDSKEALLAEVLAGSPMLDEIALGEKIMTRKIPAAERLRLLVHAHIDAWTENPHNFSVFLTDWRWLENDERAYYFSMRNSLEALFKQVILEGIELGEFSVDAGDVTILVNSILGMMNWFPRWYRPGGWADASYIADTMTNLVVAGLSGARLRESRPLD